jgi:hypothetical protein
MQNQYVLLLVSLNPDSSDLAGNVYPETGYVAAKTFEDNTDIRHGLYGTLWGQCKDSTWINKDKKAQWKVVRVPVTDPLIPIDSCCNFVKFVKGTVVFSGPKTDCCKYICEHCEEKCSGLECKLLSKTLESKDGDIVTRGESSTVRTLEPDSHAINLGQNGSAVTIGWGSHAITIRDQSNAKVLGEDGIAVSTGLKSTATADVRAGTAICCSDCGYASAGRLGKAIALGEGSSLVTGPGGFIAAIYYDGNKPKLRVAYAGEEIKANTPYQLIDGQFEEVIVASGQVA